jgi:hypothetical protein
LNFHWEPTHDDDNNNNNNNNIINKSAASWMTKGSHTINCVGSISGKLQLVFASTITLGSRPLTTHGDSDLGRENHSIDPLDKINNFEPEDAGSMYFRNVGNIHNIHMIQRTESIKKTNYRLLPFTFLFLMVSVFFCGLYCLSDVMLFFIERKGYQISFISIRLRPFVSGSLWFVPSPENVYKENRSLEVPDVDLVGRG